MLSLSLKPIGFLRTEKHVKFDTPHQPSDQAAERNVLELCPESGYREALRDLAGFTRIWLIWWFHRNTTWRPSVLPPRGPAQRRGLFATRSPHRPNPLGLTSVQLLGIDGLKLILGPCDLLDGTPVFDIKPYIPNYDAFPEERAGWIEDVDAALKVAPPYTIQFSELANTQAAWLQENFQIDFRPRLNELLSRDPTPHRTRRIRRRAENLFEIGCGAWRAFFGVNGLTVSITSLDAAYPLRFIHRPGSEAVPNRDAQIAFIERWPRADGS
ncbi:MAG TPA: tRNA (N6-threonylcarbamoyladenosine(37)-N6)-methyltransferase TrmO [Opitutaceae bacterium]|nr:tRNA (N6-threonylcarbamoyladenosine(37)-N6)-methyltransferase TrmO [Opitutaceae bacterium]